MEAIVAELARLDAQVKEIETGLADLAGSRSSADRAKEGIEGVVRQFRQAEYDSSRSYFEWLDVRREVDRFEGRAIDADDLWRSIQSAQRFRPRPAEPDPGPVWGANQWPGPASPSIPTYNAGPPEPAPSATNIRPRRPRPPPSFPDVSGGVRAARGAVSRAGRDSDFSMPGPSLLPPSPSGRGPG